MTAVVVGPALVALALTIVELQIAGSMSRARQCVLPHGTACIAGISHRAGAALAHGTVAVHRQVADAAIGADLVVLGVAGALVLAGITHGILIALAESLVASHHALAVCPTQIASIVHRTLNVAACTLVTLQAPAHSTIVVTLTVAMPAA